MKEGRRRFKKGTGAGNMLHPGPGADPKVIEEHMYISDEQVKDWEEHVAKCREKFKKGEIYAEKY